MAQVQNLVRELRSHKLHGKKQTKPKQTKNTQKSKRKKKKNKVLFLVKEREMCFPETITYKENTEKQKESKSLSEFTI